MATNGNLSEDESPPGSPGLEPQDDFEAETDITESKLKSALKKTSQIEQPVIVRPELPPQPDPETLDVSTLTPLSPEIVRYSNPNLITKDSELTLIEDLTASYNKHWDDRPCRSRQIHRC